MYHWVMARQKYNPFKPGWGEIPPHRAGHEAQFRLLCRKLERIHRGETGGGVALYGPRGNGKTVLLGELCRKAEAASLRIIEVRTGEMVGDPGRLGTLLKVQEHPPKPPSKSLLTRVLSLLRIRNGTHKLPRAKKAGIGVAEVMQAEVEFEDPEKLTPTEALLAASSRPLLMLVDEAHEMPPPFGKILLQAAQACLNKGRPLLVVLAGTPGLEENLRKTEASFWERCEHLRLGRLESEDAVRDALALPAKRSGMPIDDDALGLLVRDTQRYPYFVQLMGRESWDVAHEQEGRNRITIADAQAGIDIARGKLLMLYDGRRGEMERQGVLAAAEAVSRAINARGRDGRLSEVALKDAVESATPANGRPPDEVVETLSRLGLIWRTPSLEWEAGIPSLCSFVADRARARSGARTPPAR